MAGREGRGGQGRCRHLDITGRVAVECGGIFLFPFMKIMPNRGLQATFQRMLACALGLEFGNAVFEISHILYRSLGGVVSIANPDMDI